MANEPAYWNDLTFVDAQTVDLEAKPEDMRKLRKLIGARNGLSLAVLDAEHAHGRALFQELKARIENNCTRAPYKSAKQEATRMAWARWDLANSSDPAHLLSAAMRLHEGEKGFPPVPEVSDVVVKRVAVLKNPRLWAAYDQKRQALRGNATNIRQKLNSIASLINEGRYRGNAPLFDGFPILDRDVAETLMFHGTDATRFIVETNIDPSRGRNKGTDQDPNYGLLGQGAYFSDQLAKSATYTLCRMCKGFKCNCTSKDGTPVLRKTLLARVLLGRVHNAPSLSVAWDRGGLRGQTYNTPIKNNSDSIMAAGSGPKKAAGTNEFVVRNIEQIYPEFVVYWHHPAPNRPSVEPWDNASRVAMDATRAKRTAQSGRYNDEINEVELEQLDGQMAQLDLYIEQLDAVLGQQ